jgi:hypothetical protein
MHRGENVISFALAVVVVLTFVAIQRQWNPASLKDMASSAEDFILTSTGIRGQVPDLVGYERVKTYRLEGYRAALYRRSPASLVFAPGRFVVYNRNDQPVFKLETLEGSKDSWTTLYDFSGHHGLPLPGSRSRPEYCKSLSGNGVPDVVIGQYSGGDHCCTVATVIELGSDAVAVLGRIEGLEGLPFEGLEIRNIRKDKSWECVAHRPYMTTCGGHSEPADVLSIYAVVNGHYVDTTNEYADYLTAILRQNLAKWRQEKNPSLGLLQTLAAQFAQLGQKDEGRRFFAMNFNPFLLNLQQRGVDPNICLDELDNLMNRLPSVQPAPPLQPAPRRSASEKAVHSPQSTVRRPWSVENQTVGTILH